MSEEKITDTEIRQAMKRLSNQQRVFEGIQEVFDAYLKTREAVNGVKSEIVNFQNQAQAKAEELGQEIEKQNKIRAAWTEELKSIESQKADLANDLVRLKQEIARNDEIIAPLRAEREQALSELDAEIKAKRAEKQSILESIEQLKKRFAA